MPAAFDRIAYFNATAAHCGYIDNEVVALKDDVAYAAARRDEFTEPRIPTAGLDRRRTVLGLIAVMKNLADPSKLGHGIAAAFTATIYGIGLANLFFLPTANKLKEIIKAQSRSKEMIIEGIIAIAEGENPRNLEVKLKSFVA